MFRSAARKLLPPRPLRRFTRDCLLPGEDGQRMQVVPPRFTKLPDQPEGLGEPAQVLPPHRRIAEINGHPQMFVELEEFRRLIEDHGPNRILGVGAPGFRVERIEVEKGGLLRSGRWIAG